jgi:hypothetical protein
MTARSFIRTALILVAMVAIGACSYRDYNRLAEDYQQRSPLTEAETDFSSGDYRIYSAMGVGHYYPGVDHDVGRRIAAAHGEKILSGTSDAPESRAQYKFIQASTNFAAQYNKRKVSLIQQHNL